MKPALQDSASLFRHKRQQPVHDWRTDDNNRCRAATFVERSDCGRVQTAVVAPTGFIVDTATPANFVVTSGATDPNVKFGVSGRERFRDLCSTT